MKMKLFRRIACSIAFLCTNEAQAQTLLERLEAALPRGSGLDGETGINLDRSGNNKLVLYGEYHVMRDGYYVRWIDYTVTVTPDLCNEIDIAIRGNFGKDQDVKDMLYDLYYTALTEEVEV